MAKYVVGDIISTFYTPFSHVVYLGKIKYQKDIININYWNNSLSSDIIEDESYIVYGLKKEIVNDGQCNASFESFYKNNSRIYGYIFLQEIIEAKKLDSIESRSIKIPDNYLQLIADYWGAKANNIIKKFICKEYKMPIYGISHKIEEAIALANINGGTKSLNDYLIFS